MDQPHDSALTALLDAVRRDGFAFAPAATMRPLLERIRALADWPAFATSWNALEPDAYLAATGRARRRRHATFVAEDGAVMRAPHQPHYQQRQYNALQGGIERWFAPIEPTVGEGDSLRAILDFCHAFFGALAPDTHRWHVEAHQFRIEASAATAGEPTPEGSHRDGVDFVLVLLVDRENIASGTTTIHAPDGQLLGDFTLAHALDAALIHDPRVFHGVTPVTALDPAKPAHRDVLVVTFRAQSVED